MPKVLKNTTRIFIFLLIGLFIISIYITHRKYSTDETITVLTGLDVLLDKQTEKIKGKSIALVTNHTGVDKNGFSNYQRLMDLEDVSIKVIFTPEHGLFGEAAAGEKIRYTDKIEDLPTVVSLYGKTRKPTSIMLQGVDLILYDIQDIGARYYTYISTLGLVMETAGELGISVLVLDRPNPIRGDRIEGPLLDMTYQSFVGYYPIPIQYGLTVGELAQMIVGEGWLRSIPEVEVIPIQNWTRNLWFDETDLPWIKPSPNIPDLETAIIYPGMCLIEGTNISEGRGTLRPFKQIGAPWINGKLLSQVLNKHNLPGVVFNPVSFTPKDIPGMAMNPKYVKEKCDGVELNITDRTIYKSVTVGVYVLSDIHKLYPDKFQFKPSIDKLWGSEKLINKVHTQVAVKYDELHKECEITNYLEKLNQYKLY